MKYFAPTAIAFLFGCPLVAPTDAARDEDDAATFARAGGDLVSQTAEQALLEAPAPRLPDGSPDFSGLWIGSGPIRDIRVGLLPGEEVVLLPGARALILTPLPATSRATALVMAAIPALAAE